MRHFADRLIEAIRAVGNAVLVGIDPRPEVLPAGFLDDYPASRAGVAEALRAFGDEIIRIVAGKVPAVKFQAAFYEAYGPEGVAALFASAAEAKRRGLIVIIDGKRNDIGSTAGAYARGYLGQVVVKDHDEATWRVDAMTVNPYLGRDGIAPFVQVASREGGGLFVLVRTSNPSSGEFQDLMVEGRPFYRHVADHLVSWAEPHRGESGYSIVGAVVGATYPEQLAELREAMPGIVFLVPGYGSQGGTASDVAAAFDDQGLGAVVNSSRGIIFAYERPEIRGKVGDDWRAAVGLAVDLMIEDLAAQTPMGRLRR